MTVLVDTNIMLDIVERREGLFDDSYAIVLLAADENIDCIFSASSATDIYYIVRRNSKNSTKALEAVKVVSKLTKICDTKTEDILHAINSLVADFEDAVIAAVAERERASCIITRNIRDFAKSSVRAITPSEFLKTYNSALQP